MMRSILLAIPAAALLYVPLLSSATTIHVPGDQSSIQGAVDMAGVGDTVLVAAGVYPGDKNRDIDLHGRSLVILSEDGPEVTIIDCEGTYSDPHRGFYLRYGESLDLQGFTIQNGDARRFIDEGLPSSGAAILCGPGHLSVRNCVFLTSQTYMWGGAISCGYAEVLDSEFIGNYGDAGGGAISAGASLTVQGCLFQDNGSGSGGGAVRCPDGSTVRNCTFDGNDATSGPGALTVSGSTVVEDCVFRLNGCVYGGGGAITVTGGASPTIRNCLFEHNGAHVGGVIYFHGASGLLSDCEFISNGAAMAGGGGHGGGVCCQGASPSIARCSFVDNNVASYPWGEGEVFGGALSCVGGSAPSVTECLFIRNRSWAYDVSGEYSYGGALWCSGGSNPDLSQCIFWENHAYGSAAGGRGGAMAVSSSAPLLSSCTLVGNQAETEGSALFATRGASPVFENVIIATGQGHAAVLCDPEGTPSSPSMTCCDIFGNEGGDWIGCIADQYGINGNFSADPMFCGPSIGDFHLDAGSPCLPGQHPDGYDCGLIGAWGQGCDGFLTEVAEGRTLPTTWGLVKSIFDLRGE